MIRIHRTMPTPDRLRRHGSCQTARDCAAFEQAPGKYRSGCRRFSFNSYYWRGPVKDTLMKMHHDKCCYCETKLTTSAYLHVEHFRPKGAVCQSLDDDIEYPGYYWLAYCWENLLLSCFDCNTQHKQSVFPLANPPQRAWSHNDDITIEQEQFVNPAEEDPREHIRFDYDLPVAQTERGRHTIEGLGLRRATLTEQRRELLEIVDTLIAMVMSSAGTDLQFRQYKAKASRLLEAATEPDAKFSSMAMDYMTRRGL